ncbi:MAG: hypothetical protein A2X86_14380 [Bdellovibrionales bacterium GWA2_49_15]|nr:MAG: hypothetical protein A2X86_14380 [Bdellovibrionales bacterium GWA2_49_15]HAZ13845.1 hypothetical protein [Bdellovibrionales bacterium]
MKIALILFLLSVASFAREKGQYGVGLGLGPSMITNPARLEDPSNPGLAGGVWAKYTLMEKLDLDISYHRLDFSDLTTYTNGLTVGGSYLLMTDKLFKPYLHFGIGAGTIPHNNRDANNQIELLSMIGVGGEYQLARQLVATFQADFHAFIPTGKNNSQLYALAPLLGVTYFWEKSYVAAAIPCIVEEPVRTTSAAVQRPVSGPKKISTSKVNVKFLAGKSTFTPYYYDQLRNAAKTLKIENDVKIIITGHADKSGRNKQNEALAKARAKAVEAFLVKKLSVNPDDIIVKAYGSSRPEASNRDPAGRSANRRVEVQFVKVITE